MAKFWLLQNSDGETVCPFNDESGCIRRTLIPGDETFNRGMRFDSKEEAHDWHDAHLGDDYEGAEFFAYEYEV